MVEGFLHFMFVCVASSLIIVRALRPLQQVAFSHHRCLTDEELVVRIRILRPTRRSHSTRSNDVPNERHIREAQTGESSVLPINISNKNSDLCAPAAVFDQVGDGSCYGAATHQSITRESPKVHFFGAGEAMVAPRKDRESSFDIRWHAHLSCSLVATDAGRNSHCRVQQFQWWVHEDGYGSLFRKRRRYPGVSQILHHVKFQDQINSASQARELARS